MLKYVAQVLSCSLLMIPSLLGVDHSPYNDLLKKHVKDGLVDYSSLAKDEKILDAYLKTLEEAELESLNPQDLMALWINAYNAITLKLILETYPLDSIRDIGEHLSWQHENWTVGGEIVSLNGIEHVILRDMGDPRIHFALNCASMSCPRMWPEAFEGKILEEQLVGASRLFLEGGAIEWKGNELYLSKIFEWYAKDFGDEKAEQLKTIATYMDDKEGERLRGFKGKPKFQEYDWGLNEAKPKNL